MTADQKQKTLKSIRRDISLKFPVHIQHYCPLVNSAMWKPLPQRINSQPLRVTRHPVLVSRKYWTYDAEHHLMIWYSFGSWSSLMLKRSRCSVQRLVSIDKSGRCPVRGLTSLSTAPSLQPFPALEHQKRSHHRYLVDTKWPRFDGKGQGGVNDRQTIANVMMIALINVILPAIKERWLAVIHGMSRRPRLPL